MPISTPRRWTRRNRTGIALALIGSAALADPLDEPHLNTIPRTAHDAAWVAAVTAPPDRFDAAQTGEALPAGAATVQAAPGADAFSHPSGNLRSAATFDFKVGQALFRQTWLPAPDVTAASDGLGPLYNARSCDVCHLKDGRGHPPAGPEDDAISMVLRVSVPGGPEDAASGIQGYLATRPDPVYGMQLQDFALPGHLAEYRIGIAYEEIGVPLSGGRLARLRKPVYTAKDLGHGPLHPEAMLSPRIAPQMIGMGLLEAIPAADILAGADPDDADGDGISGRPNIVWSREFGQPMLGRFGHKASIATVREQTASAFAADIGISSPLFPGGWGDCTDLQARCTDAIHGDAQGDGLEIDDQALDFVTFYTRNLAVPARWDADDPDVLRGKEIFHQAGCAACHRPAFVTHRLAGQPEQSQQLIWPYTDMLLHDMGPGLADNRPEARATGREWRTAPLWGIGRTRQVSGHTYFLHDGRARSLLEAILWHGGEAQAQRDAVIGMPPGDRAALIRFLESL